MNKLILLVIAGTFAAITYGNTKLNNLIKGLEQKEAVVLKGTINVPYTLYNEGKGSFSDNIDSSKINFSKQFLILVRGEAPGMGARLNVKSLILKDHILTLTYKLDIAGKLVSPDSPNMFFFAVIVDKKYQGEINQVKL